MDITSTSQRIERAAELTNDLRADIAELQPQLVERRDDEASGYHRWFVRIPAARLERVALRFGEAIHQLHSSLDHAMFYVLRQPLGHIPAFPICEKEADFTTVSAIFRKQLSSAAIAVLEDVQPYSGVKFPVRLLRKLDHIDKHRRLLMAAALQTGSQATVVLGYPYEFNMTIIRGPVPDGIELGAVPMSALPRPIDQLGIGFDLSIILNEAEVASYVPAEPYIEPVPFLEAGREYVSDVLARLAACVA